MIEYFQNFNAILGIDLPRTLNLINPNRYEVPPESLKNKKTENIINEFNMITETRYFRIKNLIRSKTLHKMFVDMKYSFILYKNLKYYKPEEIENFYILAKKKKRTKKKVAAF